MKKLDEFYSEQYYFELAEKDKLLTRIQIISPIYLLYISPFIYFFKEIKLENNLQFGLVSIFLLLVSLCLFTISIIYFTKSFYGHEYLAFPKLKEIDEYHKNLVKYKNEIDDDNYSVDIKINRYLNDNYINCTTHNAEVNYQRAYKLKKSFRFFLPSIIPLVISLLIFFNFNLFDTDNSNNKYNIFVQESEMSDEKNTEPVVHNSEQENQQPVEPTPPEPRRIIEDASPEIEAIDND